MQPPGLDTADNGSQKEVFEKSATLFDSVLSFSNCIASLLRSARIAASSSLFAEASAMRSSTTRRDLQPLSREVLPIFWKMFANFARFRLYRYRSSAVRRTADAAYYAAF